MAIVWPEGLRQIKNSNDTIGNRTRDLPARSAVPQQTAPPAACPYNQEGLYKINSKLFQQIRVKSL